LKDLKKIDAQETEEQLDHHEVERIGSKGPSEFWQSNTDSHRREDDEEENKIIFSKQLTFLRYKVGTRHDRSMTSSYKTLHDYFST
jgi:hypothetical protein